MVNECLLDADTKQPTINIKTDQILQNKTWSHTTYWVKKNAWFSATACVAIIMTFLILIRNTPTTSTVASPDKMFEALREKLDGALYFPPHQAKLRANPSYEYLDPDTYLITEGSNVTIKGALVIMAHEEEVYRVHATMMDLEYHFNRRHGYPWVIIGHKVFSRHFREMITSTTKAPVSFGVAPAIEFQEPYWIDIGVAEDNAKTLTKTDADKAESMHFRRMTRYNAGFIAFHPLLKDLEYYWKVQPGARYHCDINHDPFEKLKSGDKKLSFALTAVENHVNIERFESTVKEFIGNNKDMLVPVKNSMYRALLDEAGLKKSQGGKGLLGEYSGHWSNCMISNNYMVISLDFLRSKEYNAFFDALDTSGGFFYERWGDAFPQTVAAALLLHRDQIHFDDELQGYSHGIATRCPSDIEQYLDLKCTCDPFSRFAGYQRFCTPSFLRALDGQL